MTSPMVRNPAFPVCVGCTHHCKGCFNQTGILTMVSFYGETIDYIMKQMEQDCYQGSLTAGRRTDGTGESEGLLSAG